MTELNATTELIKQWSMRGADRDIGGSFRSTDDIRALLGQHSRGAREQDEGSAAVIPLFVKQSGEEDWRPLLLGMANARERA